MADLEKARKEMEEIDAGERAPFDMHELPKALDELERYREAVASLLDEQEDLAPGDYKELAANLPTALPDPR